MQPEENQMHTIVNEGTSAMYVGLIDGGAVAVMPGESRPFPVSSLGPAWRPAPVAITVEAAADPVSEEIAKLLKKTAAEIVAAMPGMETSLVTKIGEQEQLAKQPRKTVLSAVADTLLSRSADEQAEAERLAAEKTAADAKLAAGNEGAPA